MNEFEFAASELEVDAPPKDGKWIDVHEVLENPTPEEMDAGNDAGLSDLGDGYDFDPMEIRGLVANAEKSNALRKAEALKKVMLKYGVPEVRIELRAGRPSPYGTWDSGFFVANMNHHTVSRYSKASLTPVLSLCKNGRSDLAGPLCNGYGGWDLTYRIITMGYANHPGAGGPKTVPALTAGRFTIPKDSARRYTWGTEWEGGLNEADWDKTLTNPRNGKKMTMREFMGRANAALEEFLEIHPDAFLEHSTWANGRKIDRLGYTQAKGIAEKDKYKALVIKKPAKKPLYGVSVKQVQKEFRAYYGYEGKKRKPKANQSIRRVQKCLGVKITGKVNKETADAWIKHEKKVGVVKSAKIPNTAPLAVLVRCKYKVKA